MAKKPELSWFKTYQFIDWPLPIKIGSNLLCEIYFVCKKQPQNVKTKSMKEETKSIPIHNDESYDTTDSESSDDGDDYEGGGEILNKKMVPNFKT